MNRQQQTALRRCAACGHHHVKSKCPLCGSTLLRTETAVVPVAAVPMHAQVDGCYWTAPTRSMR